MHKNSDIFSIGSDNPKDFWGGDKTDKQIELMLLPVLLKTLIYSKRKWRISGDSTWGP